MYNQISAVRVNENKHAHKLQTGFVRYMILKLPGNETRSSFEKRLFFFFSLGVLPLVVTVCRELSGIRKITSGTQGNFFLEWKE